MTRDHVLQAAYLSLVAGSMLAGAVWYLAADINAISAADNAARVVQWNSFQEMHSAITSRVSTLEAERSEDREFSKEAIDRLSTAIDQLRSSTSVSQDQQRAATNDLATAVTKLQAVLDMSKRR